MSSFIVIEGLDGAGTTTQAERLVARFRAEGQPAFLTCEPTDGPVGVLIRQMLAMRVVANIDGVSQAVNRETLALLFAADRRDHNHVDIDPALAAGKHVVSDRYYHSSLAYQGDIDGEDHFDMAWVMGLNSRARRPDITLFLEADAELCVERLGVREKRDIYESREKLTRLAGRYDQVMTLRAEAGERIVRLDAQDSITSIHEQIWALVQ